MKRYGSVIGVRRNAAGSGEGGEEVSARKAGRGHGRQR